MSKHAPTSDSKKRLSTRSIHAGMEPEAETRAVKRPLVMSNKNLSVNYARGGVLAAGDGGLSNFRIDTKFSTPPGNHIISPATSVKRWEFKG